eukprot:TRINITY_DN56143_c0_g1_i1.p1 TRINITY_DN56143_c0_g1~~TRINITY_DN56143_c0_g1_i1.p1  ORF type:complete len:217 (-),score=8.22 TRINITY_DN56143_c0_g1_i1:46-696(-)
MSARPSWRNNQPYWYNSDDNMSSRTPWTYNQPDTSQFTSSSDENTSGRTPWRSNAPDWSNYTPITATRPHVLHPDWSNYTPIAATSPHDLRRQLETPHGRNNRARSEPPNPRSRDARYAFVCVLWKGNDMESTLKHIMDALMLGASLRCHQHRFDKVLLATEDLLDMAASQILRLFWDVRPVAYLAEGTASVHAAIPRFKNVFTKLRAWELDEYAK